jgi:tripartite-type tricarboxylate transporter receptor subunit TctC
MGALPALVRLRQRERTRRQKGSGRHELGMHYGMISTDRSNEGKACDAVLRHIEARDGAGRRDLFFPEKTHSVGPVELVCNVGTQSFAFEHTRIEPFAGHIQLEAEAERHFQPTTERVASQLPAESRFELEVPAGAILGLNDRAARPIQDALVRWILTTAPGLPTARPGRYVLPIHKITPPGVPFAVGRAVRARPDGYTVDLGFLGTHVLNGAFYSLQYDLLNDFAPISPLIMYPNVLFARNTMPAKNLKELIAWMKANPDKASAGIWGTVAQLLTAFFQKETGTQLTLVPYRGVAPLIQDLVAGLIDFTFSTQDQLPLMRAKSIKAYAITSDRRLAVASDIPTFAEMGLPALSFSSWFGLFAPKGTPKGTIEKLNGAAVEAMADPAVRSRLVDLGYEIFPRERQTPDALAALVKADAAKWWPIIKEFGIKAD